MVNATLLPEMRITQDNLVEAVQKLYDVLAPALLGRDGNSVHIAGIKLTAADAAKEKI